MNAGAGGAATPFFLPARIGQRYCLFHLPPAGMKPYAAVLHVHAFGEEMNRTRRMAALQARALAAAGVAVLQIDLLGCGDSSGDFADGRWELWKEDLGLAHAWLTSQTGLPASLWCVRLGALLALDYARAATAPLGPFVFWQPVTNGKAYLTQILRLRLATELLGGEASIDAGANAGAADNLPAKAGSTQAMREHLRQGETLEIGGYAITPELANAIDAVDAVQLAPSGNRVTWLEVVADTDRPMPPASQRVIDGWLRDGVAVDAACVAGKPFWTTQEITECPTLLTATLAVLDREGVRS